MLICCSRNISDYYQCWKQLCCWIFLLKLWCILFFIYFCYFFVTLCFYCHIWSIYCVIAEKNYFRKKLTDPKLLSGSVYVWLQMSYIYSHDPHRCIYTYIKHLWSSYYASALWGKRSHDRSRDMDSYAVKLYTANPPPIYMSLLYSTNINTEIRYWRLNPMRLTHMRCC